MRQKELRIALVCYGGVSLAVYMHGVTKELWHLSRASRSYLDGSGVSGGAAPVYRRLLEHIEAQRDLRIRVLPDILSGASAGGINAIFLAQAVHSGYSLDPLTDLWLDVADVDELVDPRARPVWRFSKVWVKPFIDWILNRPGNLVSESVAPETRQEVRKKVSALIRGRWFEPPFSGIGFSSLLERAFTAMGETEPEAPLLPPRHPLDLFVTATDFHGHLSLLRLHSPPIAKESEHRIPIGFHGLAPHTSGADFANPMELVFAARATASFPGAFPPLQVGEIDELARQCDREWDTREDFLERVMPIHVRSGTAESASLIDGSVLINKPFEGAIAALRGRPAQREVDRRFVYVDPRPDRHDGPDDIEQRPVGFFTAIFGSLSAIPREQPIRDNLEALEDQSLEAMRLRRIIARLRPDVEEAVEKLFGRTFFLDKPTPARLRNWRQKAQTAAADQSGYAFQSYAQAKMAGIVSRLARLTHDAAPHLRLPDTQPIEAAFRRELARRGLDSLSAPGGGAHQDAIAFFRAHDLGFRTRRLRLLARRLARDWEADPEIPDAAVESARDSIYAILALYFQRDGADVLGQPFAKIAEDVLEDPGGVLDYLEKNLILPELDIQAEEMLAEALATMPKDLKRRMLLTYLGFPYYDVATFALLPNEGLTEFDPVKVDRISPEDALSLRSGGTRATLRGTEFYNFGAFFSRAYRENDYLWGRLHGAERMIDLVCSTVEERLADEDCQQFKRDAFLAILDEEEEAGRCSGGLIDSLRKEIAQRLA